MLDINTNNVPYERRSFRVIFMSRTEEGWVYYLNLETLTPSL